MQSIRSPQLPQVSHLEPHAVADDWAMLRGIVAVGFGLLALIWPSITFGTLTMLFGSYALIDGLFAAIPALAIEARDTDARRWLGVVSLVGLMTGVATFLWPPQTAVALLYFIAAWAIATGIAEVAGGVLLRRDLADGWLLIASGTVSFIFGVAMLALPDVSAEALVWVIGTLAILVGLFRVIVAMHIRRQCESLRDIRDRVEFW